MLQNEMMFNINLNHSEKIKINKALNKLKENDWCWKYEENTKIKGWTFYKINVSKVK